MEQPDWPSEKSLLGADDPAPFQALNSDSKLPIHLVSDHASNYIPVGLNNLGLDSAALSRHIAYDIGTRRLTEELAVRLKYRAVLCNYSRLFIDCNRNLHDSSLILPVSDGTEVPGNTNLAPEDRAARIAQIYNPYHQAISQSLRSLQQYVTAPALVSIHSFTPRLRDGDERPWHIGILWDKDTRLKTRFLEYLQCHTDLCVGDNLPYSGTHDADFTVDHHAEAQGLPCVSIEIRQDLLESVAGVHEWVHRLGRILLAIQSEPQIFSELIHG